MTSLRQNPPAVIVEICSEDATGSETFLGRFTTRPKVIALATDWRAKPKWYSLHFRNDKRRYHCEVFD